MPWPNLCSKWSPSPNLLHLSPHAPILECFAMPLKPNTEELYYPPRECMGIFGWEPATTGMHGNIWVGTPIQRREVCFESFFSVSHEEHETTEQDCCSISNLFKRLQPKSRSRQKPKDKSRRNSSKTTPRKANDLVSTRLLEDRRNQTYL